MALSWSEGLGRSDWRITWSIRLVLALAFIFSLISSSTDKAHAAKNAGYTDSIGPQCVYNWSSTYRNWWSRAAYARGGVRSVRSQEGSCPLGVYLSRPPGYIALRLYIWKYNSGNEYVCKNTSWRYNNNTSSRVGKSKFIGLKYKMPCRRGYYGTVAYGYVYNDGKWQGGAMWSGWQYLR